MNRLRVQTFLYLVVLAVGITTVTAAPSPQDEKPEPVSVDRDQIQIGDVIATGIPLSDEKCEFGRIEVTTVVPYDEGLRWVGFKLDPVQCQAVVNAKWDGLLENGPGDIINPIVLYGSGFEEILLEERLPNDPSNDNGMSVLATPGQKIGEQHVFSYGYNGQGDKLLTHTTPGQKISEQHVFSYGYGGQGDKLTHKYGGIRFSWDPYHNAFLNDRWGSCAAATWTSGLGWEWRVDSCQETSIQTQGWEVWHEGTGDYHCHNLPGGMNPCGGPTGYHHSLIDQEKGRGDGSSVCLFGHTGSVVQGPAQQILQGCS